MRRFLLVLLASTALLAAGCSNMTPQQQRALSGGAIGAAGGALLGAVAGSAMWGAALGGAAGVAAGALTDEGHDLD